MKNEAIQFPSNAEDALIGLRLGLAAMALLALVQELPPAYPRAGATSMLENEHVIVWDIAWLKQAYPVHRHRYDHVGVYYASGDRVITSTEGERRPVSTQAWNISFQLAGVTHAEEGTSDRPLRAVFVQIKRPPREGSPLAGSSPVFPVDAPEQRLDNERVNVWDYVGPAPAQPHRHVHDAVAVSFGADGRPSVRWVERGTTHDSDVLPGATRTLVFEIE